MAKVRATRKGPCRCWACVTRRWLAALALVATGASAHADVVISEIMYHDANPSYGLEFVELHNPDTVNVDLGGWRLDGAVRYTFPPGSVLEPHGYVVVARDAEDVALYYGLDILTVHQYQGGLSDGGEPVVLLDGTGLVRDRVIYNDLWPWPVVADGGGPSLERIDAREVEAGDPSAWLPAQNADAWRLVERIGHVTSTAFQLWLSGTGVCLIDDVRVTPLYSPAQNLLVNGTFDSDIAGWRKAGTHRDSIWDSTEGHGETGCLRIVATAAGSDQSYVGFSLTGNPTPWDLYTVSFYVKWVSGARELSGRFAGEGTSFEASLYGFGTPGRTNSAARTTRPPVVMARELRPRKPTSEDEVSLFVVIRSEVPPDEVRLTYHVNFGAPQAVEMAAAGPGVWSATIPRVAATSVVRYRMIVKTADGEYPFPRSDDPTPNYAYLVHDDDVESPLPLVWLFISSSELSRLNANVWSDNYVRGTIAFGRDVYDHIRVRYRGGSVRDHPKKFYKVKFNRGRRWNGQKTINLNAEYPDYSRIRTHMAHALFQEIGVLASDTEFCRLYLNRVYRGVYLSVEEPEEPYLSRQGRDTGGNLYKVYTNDRPLGTVREYYDKYHKETNQQEDRDDVIEFIISMDQLPPSEIVSYIEDRVDIERVLAYIAVNAALGNRDWGHKNHYFYRNPDTDLWEFAVWDVDLVMGKDWDPACGGVFCHQGFVNQAIYMGWSQTGAGEMGVFNRVADRILAIAAFRSRYEEVLVAVLLTMFTEERMLPWIDRLYDLISADTLEEIRRYPTYNRQMTEAQYWQQRDVLKAWVPRRHAFIFSRIMLPVTGLTCSERDGNAVAISWDVTPGHVRDRITVDGVEVARPLGDAGSYLTDPLPRGEHEICVTGLGVGKTSPPVCCRVTLVGVAPPADVAAELVVLPEGPGVHITWKNSEAYSLVEIFLDRGDGLKPAVTLTEGEEEATIALHDLTGVSEITVGVEGELDGERSDRGLAAASVAIKPVNVVFCMPGSDGRSAKVFYEEEGPRPGAAFQEIEVLASGRAVARFDPAQHPQFFELESTLGLAGHLRITLTGSWYGAVSEEGTACEVDFEGDVLFVRGDVDSDGAVRINDPVALLMYLFLHSHPIPCEAALDIQVDGSLNIGDAIALLGYLFVTSGPPPPPFPECGPDPDPQGLSCESFPGCL